ncbi:transglycosylase domain-containing protein [Flavobacterium psychrotolerans]|uniref:Glycosyl transferase n=1 Tax=Flavobacterium psychrotolerans TaxID=2169410 RepID=A0A2U1JJ65_9FLAO|nr:biosynthetic peptidoglycan transglycosylase [Flavobacterium psychrotolerans]PWA05210.1 glycosyl transferase [Flavobacterium psychrotolerans]
MRTKKQKAFLIAKIVSVFFVLVIVGLFVFRDALLQKTLVSISRKMEQDFNSSFSVKKAIFVGVTGVEMDDVLLVPKNADTLFRIENIKTRISFWHLLTGTIRLESLDAKNGYVQLVKNENGRNFDAFLLKKKDSTNTGDKPNYAKLAYRILNRALNLVPTDMRLENLSLRMNDMGHKSTISLQKLELVDKKLESSIQVQTNTFNQRWKIKGIADPRNKQTDIRFFNIDTGKIKVPYFDERYNIKSSFDSIRLNVSNIDMDNGELHIDGFTSISNFTVNHHKIASKDVVIKNARFDYHLLFGENFIAVDSSSTVLLNQIKVNPYVSYTNETDKIYTLKMTIPKMKAQDFISSLPEGLFTHFKGMEANGNFDYHLDFVFNKNKPNAVVFDSKLNKENLQITKYGEANIDKLNGEFVYRAIINNVPQRPILVGSGNPNYTPLSRISPYLRKSVLTTEDPSFFSHKGFINEAFKQSIVKNIRTKKFSRGGSTISMQLIKNVFLTREKTLSRKLEEILLVYIMENNKIVSKERMLEVYFNIIEWGPNVYGIGEASSFYFQKSPSELTLNECLYLANIIPSPRKFMYQFNSEGNLKSFAVNRDKQLKRLMMRRGIIVSEDTIYQMPILITGSARSYIKTKVEEVPTEIEQPTSIEEFDF